MAKKKKTQLKPVVRGFATTSVPKKVVQSVEEPTEAEPLADDGGLDGGETKKDQEDARHQVDEFDPDKADEQSLQNLVDKFQEKTEKEIVRTVKAIEQERRFSKTLPRLELDPLMRDRVLALALEQESLEGNHGIEESEEKALVRLGVTYGVLRRLGFSESRVEQCLRSINGIDLEEAYQWLYLHCPEEELEPEKNTPNSKTPQLVRTPRTPHSPSIPSTTLESNPPSRAESRLNVNAPAFVPSTPLVLAAGRGTAENEHAATKSRILEAYGSSFESESADIEDPNLEYVRLKMQITHAQRQQSKTGTDFIAELQSRLEEVTKHYFFDQKDAEAHYRVEKEKADASEMRLKLRGHAPAGLDKLPSSVPLEPNPKPSALPEPQVSLNIFDSDDEDSGAGAFDILEVPTTETTPQGTTIEVRDLPLPKHWSGRTPKKLLSETVSKNDRYATVVYRCVSGASRAKRAAVIVGWGGGRSREWIMEEIACHDMVQAENYVATLALHELTFPSTDGFASMASAASGGQTSFRLLPAVFRDLWEEFETKRKSLIDGVNRQVWAKLRDVVEPKLDNTSKWTARDPTIPAEPPDRFASRTLGTGYDIASEQLRAGFKARQSSPGYQEMLQYRSQLPIAHYREEIISILENSQILVLSGETGCGKSTQVPTFILEDQLSQGRNCKIYCTEPRRISAISLAQRVSRELGDPPGAVGTMSSLVGYSIRLESNTSKNTRLAFVTNGIALRMLEGGTGTGGRGTAFDEITHVIIDEVHERSIESDFLLIVLKSLMEYRRDLKIILMSATVDANKISAYFGGCPTLHVPGRTFPVDIRYLEDAVEFSGWSIQETSPYARRLHDKYRQGKAPVEWSEQTAADEDDDSDGVQATIKLERRYSTRTMSTVNLLDERTIPYDLIIRLLERICFEDHDYFSYSAAVLVFMPGMGEIRRLNDILSTHPQFRTEQFRIHPLHSTISSENQSLVFDVPPSGVRKIVIATNIAETGITIPDITCVIDSGKHREMRFDEKRQLSRLVETFIARSNAAQRRGRAGRVQDGLCFHLFTRVRHDTLLADHPLPEMTRLSLSDLALRIKIMKVKLGTSIEDVLSRALDPPSSLNIQRAVSALVEVRALSPSEEITPMGRLLSKLPTDVHLGKFLLVATLFRCLDPALTIAATLNSKSPFLTPFGFAREAELAKSSFRVDNSDFLTLHNAFSSWRRASATPGIVDKFCRQSYLSHQNLQQIEELRQQFLGYLIDASFIEADRTLIRDLSRTRFGRGRTRFVTIPPDLDCNSSNYFLVNAALTAGLYPKILSIDPRNGHMQTISNSQIASFHPSSVNFGRNASDFGVNHLHYFTLMHSKKLYAWETGPADDIGLLLLCGECDFKLISDSAFIDRKIKFRIPPKSNIALKWLRTQLGSLLAAQFRGRPIVESQVYWNELAMMILGKVKPQEGVGPGAVSLINNQR
ncbi:hypothetical protein JAAARDRAFT_119632 [Jaapia argillacea MUCL 33604]|uniref:RNA helicase n=1 Tax=Jaapia argillacea MUCL 33604 TaxID=933084 RepID=A0A067Q9H8_9AGAM|nr:hypothetical protein JAAARDRAFT_119632 [Jaapia argillacea MUCL 33604]